MSTEFDFKKFKEKAIDELRSGKGISGKDNVLLPLIKHILEEGLKAELDSHMKEERDQSAEAGNRKNGVTSKTMKTSIGNFTLDTPRDREGNFNPELVKKQQTYLDETFSETILSLYSKGLSHREIQKFLIDTYGTQISSGKISDITDRIMPEIKQWQERQLESIYSIVWLDAIHFSVKDEKTKRYVKKAVYIVLGLDLHGRKDVLSFTLGENESASFWSSVLVDLRNRGVDDILIACIDNLSGFNSAIEAHFPKTDIQHCIIHQIRNSMKYCAHKDSKALMSDLKDIYKAVNISAATTAMDVFEDKWTEKYPVIVNSWRDNWEYLTRFFDYAPEIRRIMYTTNTVEGLNRQIRKYTKSRGPFSGDKALEKIVYVALKEISRTWISKPPYWGQVQQQLLIRFEERCGIIQ